MSAPKIRAVVFDVGWVLLHLRPKPILSLLARHGVAIDSIGALISRVALHDHESGRLSGGSLLDNIARLTADPPHRDEIHAHWVDMFEFQPEMTSLAHRLTDHYRVYVLSNVGDLHWMHMTREYGIHRLAQDALPSFLAGVMKPEGAIYAAAEQRFALDPATTVFIDDRPENIAACQARGWHGIVHQSPAATVAALGDLGVRV